MTGRAVFDDALARPVGDPLAVGAPDPVDLLSEVALAAYLVGVIHRRLDALFRFQQVPIALFVACKTGQRPLPAMIQRDIPVGRLRGPFNRDFFVVVALTASKALDLIHAALRSEKPPLVFYLHLDRVPGRRRKEADPLFIIERGRGFFYRLRDTPGSGVYTPPREKNKQRGRDPYRAFFTH